MIAVYKESTGELLETRNGNPIALEVAAADFESLIKCTLRINMTGTILLILLIILLLGAVPAWPHSRSWGFFPSGTLGAVIVVLVALLLMGRI